MEKVKRKHRNRNYKKYIRKQIKKSLDERLFKKFKINKGMLPDVKLKVEKVIEDIPAHNSYTGMSF